MTSEYNVKPESLSKNMRILILLATVIVIAITIALALKKPLQITEEITQETLQQEIQAIQQQLPIRVDGFTELNYVEVTEMGIKYSFIVVDDPTQNSKISVNDESFAQQVETAVKTSACLNEGTRRYINSNVSLSYRYKNKDNIPIADFIIPAGFCSN